MYVEEGVEQMEEVGRGVTGDETTSVETPKAVADVRDRL